MSAVLQVASGSDGATENVCVAPGLTTKPLSLQINITDPRNPELSQMGDPQEHEKGNVMVLRRCYKY